MNRSKLFTLILSAVAMASTASAAITLVDPAVDNTFVQYQQSSQNPCVIGDSSCSNPAGFGYTLLPAGGNVTSYDSTSPTYTVAQIAALVGTTFGLGLDLNNTGSAQTVTLVSMTVNGTDTQSWSGTWTNTALNNGTGFSDLNFLGFTLVGYAATDTVTFRLVMPTVNDGRENLFLVNTGGGGINEIPEPSSMALIGTGLAGLGFMARRRRK